MCDAVLTFTNCMLTDGAQTCLSLSSPLPFSPHLFSPLHPSLFLLSSISLTRRWYGKNARSEASNNGSTKSACSSMPRVVQSRPMVFVLLCPCLLQSSHTSAVLVPINDLLDTEQCSKRAFCSNSLVRLKGDGPGDTCQYHCAGPATCSDGGDACRRAAMEETLVNVFSMNSASMRRVVVSRQTVLNSHSRRAFWSHSS